MDVARHANVSTTAVSKGSPVAWTPPNIRCSSAPAATARTRRRAMRSHGLDAEIDVRRAHPDPGHPAQHGGPAGLRRAPRRHPRL